MISGAAPALRARRAIFRKESRPFVVRHREASGVVADRSIASAWRTRYSFTGYPFPFFFFFFFFSFFFFFFFFFFSFFPFLSFSPSSSAPRFFPRSGRAASP